MTWFNDFLAEKGIKEPWFDGFLQSKGVTAGPPPKKSALDPFGVNPVLQLGIDKIETLLKAAGSQAVDMVKGELKSRYPLMGMVGPGELGAAAPGLRAGAGKLLARLLEPGGATLTKAGEHFAGSAYMVADPALTVMAKTPEEVTAFLKRADVKAAVKAGGHYGKWTDPKTGISEINVSQPFGSKADALAVAHGRGEKAIGHIADGKYQGDIPTVPPKVGAPAVRFWIPGKKEPEIFTGAAHPFARNAAEDKYGDLLDKNFQPRFRSEDGYWDGKTWLTREQGLASAKYHKQLGGNPKALEAMKRSGQLKSEGLKREDVYAHSLEAPPAPAAPAAQQGFGLGGHIPEQTSLSYFRGPRTKPEDLTAAYEMSRKAFRHNGPYSKYLAAGRKYPGAEPWYDTRQIYRDAADVIGEDAAAGRVNNLLGLHMPASTARSAPPSNLKRAFLWQQLVDQGLVTPEILRSNKIIMPEGFGHFAQNAHQSTLARSLELGSVNPAKNPKPASFGANLTGNQQPGTFDTVMGRILRSLNKKSSRFFGANAEGESAPKMWAYQPLERGLADAAHEAAAAGLLHVEPGVSPVAAYQSLGWHGATGSAEYGSMADIWNTLRSKSAEKWGVSPGKANEMIWGEGRVPLMPHDAPLLEGLLPRLKKK